MGTKRWLWDRIDVSDVTLQAVELIIVNSLLEECCGNCHASEVLFAYELTNWAEGKGNIELASFWFLTNNCCSLNSCNW